MISILSLAHLPMRATPNHQAAMVSELLFGETFLVLNQKESWYYIETTFDQYRGWVNLKPHIYTVFSQQEYRQWQNQSQFTTAYITQLQNSISQHHLSLGSCISSSWTFSLGEKEFYYSQNLEPIQNLETIAKRYLNVPYLWGGRSVFGIDCSGFIQQVFKHVGIFLPRDAYQQAAYLEEQIQPAQAQLGDLMFCYNEQKQIDHVALILNSEELIHASGSVHISRWNQNGILEADQKILSHPLACLKHVEL